MLALLQFDSAALPLIRDGKLHPISADFDLYSVGKDGKTVAPLPPPQSHDDIIRARDGRFIGLGRDFDP